MFFFLSITNGPDGADTLVFKWTQVQYLVLLSHLKLIVWLYFYNSRPFSSVSCAWLCILLWALPKLGRPALSTVPERIVHRHRGPEMLLCCVAPFTSSHLCKRGNERSDDTYQHQNSTFAPETSQRIPRPLPSVHATVDLLSKAILYLSTKQSNISMHQRGWVFCKTLVTICWYKQRKHSVPYHCMSDDNSARLQPTHYNHYFKEGKRPMAHILSLPLYPVTARCKQTKTTVVNMKCSTNQTRKECDNNQTLKPHE